MLFPDSEKRGGASGLRSATDLGKGVENEADSSSCRACVGNEMRDARAFPYPHRCNDGTLAPCTWPSAEHKAQGKGWTRVHIISAGPNLSHRCHNPACVDRFGWEPHPTPLYPVCRFFANACLWPPSSDRLQHRNLTPTNL